MQKLQHPVRVRRDEESMSDSLISIKQLSFRYRDQEDRDALTNINLDIKNGEFIVVMGGLAALASQPYVSLLTDSYHSN